MGHKIAEAIIENGKLIHIDRKMPPGKIKVHIIYDIAEDTGILNEINRIIRETSGLYRNIDADAESAKLRAEWERNVSN